MVKKLTLIKNNSKLTNQKRGKQAGILTVIFSNKNGKRLVLSTHLVEAIGIENHIQIGFSGESLVICKCESEDEDAFELKKLGKKKVLYKSSVIEAIKEKLDLDFDQSVSYTFYDVVLDEYNDQTVAMFKKEHSK